MRFPRGFALAISALGGAALAAASLLWGQNFIATDRCMDAGGAYDEAWQVCDKSTAELNGTQYTGAVYAGLLGGQHVRLQLRDDALGYRMMAPPLRILGDLNTLRGFGRDDNAVVYVLNANVEEARQIRFLLNKNGTRNELVRIGPGDTLSTQEVLRTQPSKP